VAEQPLTDGYLFEALGALPDIGRSNRVRQPRRIQPLRPRAPPPPRPPPGPSPSCPPSHAASNGSSSTLRSSRAASSGTSTAEKTRVQKPREFGAAGVPLSATSIRPSVMARSNDDRLNGIVRTCHSRYALTPAVTS